MTSSKKANIKCPACGHDFEAPVYVSVNVSLDPSLKKKVLEGEINLTQCSRCKEETIVESNLLYNDMDNKLWLQVTLGDEAGWSDEEAKFRNDLKSLKDKHPGAIAACKEFFEEYTYRLVFRYHQLREKILAFDANLDDRIIEFNKLYSLLNFEPVRELHDNGAEIEITFDGVEDDQLIFTCFSSVSDPIGYSLGRRVHDDMLDDSEAMDEVQECFKNAFYVNFNRVYMNLQEKILEKQS